MVSDGFESHPFQLINIFIFNLSFINIIIIISTLNFPILYISLFYIIFYSFLSLSLSLHFISYYISVDNDDVDDIGGSVVGSINVSNAPISTSSLSSPSSIFLYLSIHYHYILHCVLLLLLLDLMDDPITATPVYIHIYY